MKLMGKISHQRKTTQTAGLQVIWGMLHEDSWDIIYEWVDELYQIINFSTVDFSLWSI